MWTHDDEAIDVERVYERQTLRTMIARTALDVARGIDAHLDGVLAEGQNARRPDARVVLDVALRARMTCDSVW